MARIRTIKPQFWTDESVVDLPFEYRLLFIGLWNFADDEGFLEDKPKQIKLWVFPADDVNVTAGLRALVKAGLLESLTLAGNKVLRIKGWNDHQVISRPTKSKYADDYAIYQAPYGTHGVLHETHGVLHETHGAPIGTPSGREGKGKERKGKEVTQVGGGGNLSRGGPKPPPPTSDLTEPWRCPEHQGVDVPCHACKAAKAAHRAAEAAAAQAIRAAKRDADANARAQRKAEEAATPRATPEDVERALAFVKQATTDRA